MHAVLLQVGRKGLWKVQQQAAVGQAAKCRVPAPKLAGQHVSGLHQSR